MPKIIIEQSFNAPQETVFKELSNHENFGKIVNAKIVRIKDATGNDPNGVGSVRSIQLGIELLQETVTKYESPNLIEYKITSKTPMSHHLGRLQFSTPTKGTTHLLYTIEMESKLPAVATVTAFVLNLIIKNGLKRFAAKYK